MVTRYFPAVLVGATSGLTLWLNFVAPATPTASAESDNVSVALFFDSTEIAYRVADRLYESDPTGRPRPPTREFVTDANDAHERLLSGRNPIVGMSLDDVVSLVDSGDPRADELVVIAGVHTGFLLLITDPRIADVASLRSNTVAVDTDTGYASALFHILALSGLRRGIDYTVDYAGATNRRYQKLLDGDFQATLLGAPFTDLALSRGFRSQGSVRQMLGGYQGVVLVTKRGWLIGHGATARAVVASLIAAERWAMEPTHLDEVRAIVMTAVPGLDGDEAVAAVTETLFGPGSEYQPDGHLSKDGINVVVDLYNKSRGRAVSAASVTDLTDYSYLPPERG